MSKLFCKVEDQKGTEVHKQGSELDIKVYYGSSSDSRLCLHLTIVADKNDAFELPKIFYSAKTELTNFALEPDYIKEALRQTQEQKRQTQPYEGLGTGIYARHEQEQEQQERHEQQEQRTQ